MRTKTELNGMVGPIVFIALLQAAVWIVITKLVVDGAIEIARIIWG